MSNSQMATGYSEAPATIQVTAQSVCATAIVTSPRIIAFLIDICQSLFS